MHELIRQQIAIIREKNPSHWVMAFLNGQRIPDLSDQATHPLDFAWRESSGFQLTIRENTQLTQPLHLLFFQDQANTAFRNTLRIEKNSQLKVIEEHRGLDNQKTSNQVVTDIYAAEDARVEYYKIRTQLSSQITTTTISQKLNSVTHHFSLTIDSDVSYDTVHVDLLEKNASCDLSGFYALANHQQSIDQQLQVEHHSHQGVSNMFYKGILDKKSKANFVGKVKVNAHTQKNQAKQANHNLLLSDQAEALCKPELEIYADDLKCSHGATVGQLDPDALFYLRARGIHESDAKALLLSAFANEVTSHIPHAGISRYLSELISQGVRQT